MKRTSRSSYADRLRSLALRIRLVTLLGIAVATSVASHQATATSCVAPEGYDQLSSDQEIRYRVQTTDVVFAGRIVAVDEHPDHERAYWTFEVLRIWKGKVSRTEKVMYQGGLTPIPQRQVGTVYMAFVFGESGNFQSMAEECGDGTVVIPERGGRPLFPAALGRGKKP